MDQSNANIKNVFGQDQYSVRPKADDATSDE
jgi:hypothetical protein